MKIIKTLIPALAALMILPACGEAAAPAGNTQQTGAAAETAAETEPEIRFDGETVNLGIWAMPDVASEAFVEEQNGEIVNDAVYSRNLAVEEKLGVTLNVIQVGPEDFTAVDNVTKSIQAGEALYDVCWMPTIAAAQASVNGYFLDLTKLPNLDLTARHWSQGVNSEMKIGSGQYLASGSPAISMLRYIYVTVCNNALFSSYDLDVPLGDVRDGVWTFDRQSEISRDIYTDLDGNGKNDINDLYGFAAGARTGIDTFWTNCGASLYGRDSAGFYTFEPKTERYAQAVDAILNLYYGGPGSFVLTSSKDNFRGQELSGMFAAGRAMMLITPIYCIETYMRDMQDEFTVIPMAKLDESQPSYRSYVQDQFTSCFVPVTVTGDRTELAGAFLDIYGSESYDSVFNAYYENALSYKYMQNAESVEMLRLIVDSVVIDPSCVYSDEGGIKVELRNMVAKNNNTLVSTIASVESRVTGVLESLNSSFDWLQ